MERGERDAVRNASGRRAPYLPLRRRAARFLDGLAKCGNVTLALENAGLGRDRAYRHRREDPAFAAAWEAALDAFARALDAEEELEAPADGSPAQGGLGEAALDRNGLVLRRGRGGRLQVVARRPNAWSRRKEDVFVAAFGATANVSAAARAAGMSPKAAFERIRDCPRFAERIEAAKDAAYDRLELALMEQGSTLLEAEEPAMRDAGLAMWLLKRRDQAAAGTLRRGAGVLRDLPSAESVTEKILAKVAAIKRHRAREAGEAAEGGAGDGGSGGDGVGG